MESKNNNTLCNNGSQTAACCRKRFLMRAFGFFCTLMMLSSIMVPVFAATTSEDEGSTTSIIAGGGSLPEGEEVLLPGGEAPPEGAEKTPENSETPPNGQQPLPENGQTPPTGTPTPPAAEEPAPLQPEFNGYVWNDTNQNGIQDEDEPGINGLTVVLEVQAGDGSWSQTATTTTHDENVTPDETGEASNPTQPGPLPDGEQPPAQTAKSGYFTFKDLPPATYRAVLQLNEDEQERYDTGHAVVELETTPETENPEPEKTPDETPAAQQETPADESTPAGEETPANNETPAEDNTTAPQTPETGQPSPAAPAPGSTDAPAGSQPMAARAQMNAGQPAPITQTITTDEADESHLATGAVPLARGSVATAGISLFKVNISFTKTYDIYMPNYQTAKLPVGCSVSGKTLIIDPPGENYLYTLSGKSENATIYITGDKNANIAFNSLDVAEYYSNTTTKSTILLINGTTNKLRRFYAYKDAHITSRYDIAANSPAGILNVYVPYNLSQTEHASLIANNLTIEDATVSAANIDTGASLTITNSTVEVNLYDYRKSTAAIRCSGPLLINSGNVTAHYGIPYSNHSDYPDGKKINGITAAGITIHGGDIKADGWVAMQSTTSDEILIDGGNLILESFDYPLIVAGPINSPATGSIKITTSGTITGLRTPTKFGNPSTSSYHTYPSFYGTSFHLDNATLSYLGTANVEPIRPTSGNAFIADFIWNCPFRKRDNEVVAIDPETKQEFIRLRYYPQANQYVPDWGLYGFYASGTTPKPIKYKFYLHGFSSLKERGFLKAVDDDYNTVLTTHSLGIEQEPAKMVVFQPPIFGITGTSCNTSNLISVDYTFPSPFPATAEDYFESYNVIMRFKIANSSSSGNVFAKIKVQQKCTKNTAVVLV